MPTTKKRINITLPKTMDMMITKAAHRDGIPTATKAMQLLQFALETEEDTLWDKLASTRDTRNAKFISHAKTWV